MNYWFDQIRGLKTFLPTLSQVIANFPLLILFLWITFIFSIVVYFLGGAKDLEQKMGKGFGSGLSENSSWAGACDGEGGVGAPGRGGA